MLTFSLNKTDEEFFEACRIVYNNFEDIKEVEDIRIRKDPYAEGRSELLIKCLTALDKYQGVNVIGYAIRCEQFSRYSKINREINIVDVEEFEHGYRGVTDSYLCNSIKSQFEESDFDRLINRIDFETGFLAIIAEFEEFYMELSIERGINIKTLIKRALAGDTRAIKRVAAYVKEFRKEELMKTILTNIDPLFDLLIKDVPLPNRKDFAVGRSNEVAIGQGSHNENTTQIAI